MKILIAILIIAGVSMLALYAATAQDTNAPVVVYNPVPHPASIQINGSGEMYYPAGTQEPTDSLLAPVVDALKFCHVPPATISKVCSVLALIGALKILLHGRAKGVAVKVQQALSYKLAWHTETTGSDHDVYVREILTWRPYKTTAMLFDIVFSVQLPSLASYEAQIAAQKTPPGTVSLPANLKSS